MKKNYAIVNGTQIIFSYGSKCAIYEELCKFAKKLKEPLKVARQQFYYYFDNATQSQIVLNFAKPEEELYNGMFAEHCMIIFNDIERFNEYKECVLSMSEKIEVNHFCNY